MRLVWSVRGLAKLGSVSFCQGKALSKTDLTFFAFRGEKSERRAPLNSPFARLKLNNISTAYEFLVLCSLE